MSTRVQRVAERRVVFAPLADAFATLQLAAPIAVLGSVRSAALAAGAFGDGAVHRFEGAQPHNPRAVVDAAVAFVAERRCATVVAIGSSSAIDLGKVVSDRLGLPLAAVPTALGGAEMSRGYGILDADGKSVGRIAAPAPVVVYDASLLATLPQRELGAIGINAWAHCIEAAYARLPHVLGTAAAIEGGRMLPRLLMHAVTKRDHALHYALFEAAHLAGFALDARSMGLHHAICHAVGGITRIPHGVVNAIVLPHAVRANLHLARGPVTAVAKAFDVDDLVSKAQEIAHAYALPPTLARAGAAADVVERALPHVMASPLLDNNPVRPDEETVRSVLRRAYEGA